MAGSMTIFYIMKGGGEERLQSPPSDDRCAPTSLTSTKDSKKQTRGAHT